MEAWLGAQLSPFSGLDLRMHSVFSGPASLLAARIGPLVVESTSFSQSLFSTLLVPPAPHSIEYSIVGAR